MTDELSIGPDGETYLGKRKVEVFFLPNDVVEIIDRFAVEQGIVGENQDVIRSKAAAILIQEAIRRGT